MANWSNINEGDWTEIKTSHGPTQESGDHDADIRFVNSPSDMPTYYADTCMFAIDLSGTVRMQFAEAIPGAKDSPDPGTKMRYVGTLVMPFVGFTSMVEYFNNSLHKGDGPDGKK